MEFVEYVLLFLEEEKRSLLLAVENERLLRRVAVCFVLTWVQKARLRKSHSVCFSDLPASDLSKLATSGADLFVETLSTLTVERLHHHILQLPIKQRQCAVRRWLEDQPVSDIAANLRLTPAAVRKNLQYARDSIRKGFQEMGYEGKDSQ